MLDSSEKPSLTDESSAKVEGNDRPRGSEVWKPRFHQIYFLLDLDNNRVKIGRTRQYIFNRIRAVASQENLDHRRLKLIYVFASLDKTAEGSIHLLLREYRQEGEWFTNGIHIPIAIELWLRNGSAVEHLRIVRSIVLSRLTGEVAAHVSQHEGIRTKEEILRAYLGASMKRRDAMRGFIRRITQEGGFIND